METVHSGGCNTFIVHARIAILKGLSPKEVRQSKSPSIHPKAVKESFYLPLGSHAGGCNTFIVHARVAILKGLSPKEAPRS